MKKNEASAKIIADRMKRAAKLKTYSELGAILGGITSQAISGAIAKRKIPEHWFDLIHEKTGVTREELTRPAEQVVATSTAVYDLRADRQGQVIQASGGGSVIINKNDGQPEANGSTLLSPREHRLIMALRRYGNDALLDQWFADLELIRQSSPKR